MTAKADDGRSISCVLLKNGQFEDVDDYGAVYDYDAERNVLVRSDYRAPI